MKASIGITGQIQIYKIHRNGWRELVFDKKNTVSELLHNRVRNSLFTRSQDNGVDCIVWGSEAMKGGTEYSTFCDGTYSGTTSSGTGGALSQMTYGDDPPYQVRYSGTFSFLTSKKINFFGIGRGYVAPGAGVMNMLTVTYAYDNSLTSTNNYVQYDNGETLVVNWILQVS